LCYIQKLDTKKNGCCCANVTNFDCGISWSCLVVLENMYPGSLIATFFRLHTFSGFDVEILAILRKDWATNELFYSSNLISRVLITHYFFLILSPCVLIPWFHQFEVFSNKFWSLQTKTKCWLDASNTLKKFLKITQTKIDRFFKEMMMMLKYIRVVMPWRKWKSWNSCIVLALEKTISENSKKQDGV
jgi:hypothetical protein